MTTTYRLLERQTAELEWVPDGVAYTEDDLFLLFRSSQIWKLPVSHLQELDDRHFPYEKGTVFRWGPLQTWEKSEPFTPQTILEADSHKPKMAAAKPKYLREEELPAEIRQVLSTLEAWNENQAALIKEQFILLLENGYPLFRMIVEAIWRQWSTYNEERPPFPHAEHNVALLLYARAFGLPVDEYQYQVRYLEQHKDLFAPVMPKPKGWGARTSIAGSLKTLMDAPVMHVWAYKDGNSIQKMLILGKGPHQFQSQLFTDFLITAMRVQASAIDMINDGAVSIGRSTNPQDALQITLPVLGADVPLPDTDASDTAFQELMRRLKQLEQNTGFVQIHEVDLSLAESFQNELVQLAREAIREGQPILWAPAPDGPKQELVLVQQVIAMSKSGPIRRVIRTEPIAFEMSLDLFRSERWKALAEAFQEESVNTIFLDAKIRLDYYNRRFESLTAEKKRWDTADEETRLEQWGPTITLNQRFDDNTGLTVWLQKPTIKSTKEYFEDSVPNLLHGYKSWADKMQKLIDDLREAANRPDSPFMRLIMTRLYDAAIRGVAIRYSARVEKLYVAWEKTAADLLRYDLRRRLRQVGANERDLFTTHTTFNLVQVRSASGKGVERIVVVPNTLIDFQRSVAVFDPDRSFMVVTDASDQPVRVPQPAREIDLLSKLKHEWRVLSVDQLAEKIRAEMIQNPAAAEQILQLVGTQTNAEMLTNDKIHIQRLHQQAQLETLNFVRLLDLGENATISRAQVTMLESMESAQKALSQIVERWNALRAENSDEDMEATQPIPSQSNLECRIYLLKASMLSLIGGYTLKEHLTSLYRSPIASGAPEIQQALESADRLNPEYTKKWIDSLAQWDSGIALSMLKQNLPSEKDLLNSKQHQVVSMFDALELIKVAKHFREVIALLNPNQESRSTAFLKIGPALETALTSYPAGIVYNEVIHLLEILTGREVIFQRGI